MSTNEHKYAMHSHKSLKASRCVAKQLECPQSSRLVGLGPTEWLRQSTKGRASSNMRRNCIPHLLPEWEDEDSAVFLKRALTHFSVFPQLGGRIRLLCLPFFLLATREEKGGCPIVQHGSRLNLWTTSRISVLLAACWPGNFVEKNT